LFGALDVTPPNDERGKSIRVLVADSNQTQSQLLSSALRRQPGITVTCCRGELGDCKQVLRSAPVDIVLLSDSPTHHDQLVDILRDLHASYPNSGLILLLDRYDRNLVVNAMRSGTRGLFCRTCQPFRALCRCISAVHQGQFWANTEQIGYLVEALNSVPQARVVDANGDGILTSREEQIVGLVAEGISNHEVAHQLGIKENTVKKALLRVYDKLGVSNRVEAVLYVLTHSGLENRLSAPSSKRLALDCKERDQVNVLETDDSFITKAKRQSSLEEGTTRASRGAAIPN
jgi:DNA-binding NarL/FixJ family response regulator